MRVSMGRSDDSKLITVMRARSATDGVKESARLGDTVKATELRPQKLLLALRPASHQGSAPVTRAGLHAWVSRNRRLCGYMDTRAVRATCWPGCGLHRVYR